MTFKLFKPFASLIACIVVTSLSAQTGNYQNQKIAPALLKQDFVLLRDTLQKTHPGLYVYKNKVAYDKMLDSCLSAIKDSLTLTDFYALTSFAVASIGDGHTNCRLSNQMMNDYYDSVNVFPAMVMFINNRAFIFCCKQNPGLAESEVLSINDHPINEIVSSFFQHIPSDGFIQSRKNWELPENFQFLFNILYGTHNSYKVTCKTKAGEIITTNLQADNIEDIFCKSPFPRPSKYLQLTYEPGNIAVLTIKSFFNDLLARNGENFNKFLDSSFVDIKNKKTQKLLIDLRGNQGGNDQNGELLYSYLTDKPFKYYAYQTTVDGEHTAEKHPDLALQQPEENNFKGKLYILLNGRSFSASAEFSSIVKTNNRGIFIGEECGGGYYGNTSGAEAYVTLPNTKITVRVPLVRYSMAVKKIGYNIWGIKPDYPVYQTISDIVQKKDGQFDYAIHLIGNL
jgi:hypothetical protein